jgi:hypothetical protein
VPFTFSPSTEQNGVWKVFRKTCGIIENGRSGRRKGRGGLGELVEGAGHVCCDGCNGG